jgi:uncharacterized membrane protein
MSAQDVMPPAQVPAPTPAPMTSHDPRARAVELLISNLLRIGVMASLLIVAAGTVVIFVQHRDYLSQPSAMQRLTTPGAAFPHTLSGVLHGLQAGRGQSIVVVGLLLLIATPVMRVAVSILGFVYEHDRRYVIITSIVLLLLLLSFVLGKAEG